MEDKIWDCIIKRLTETETEDSKSFLNQWLLTDPGHVQQYEEAKALWELSALLKPEMPELSFSQISERIELIQKQPKGKFYGFWKYGIAAALTGIFLLIGLYGYKYNFNKVSAAEWVVQKADAGKLIKIGLPDGSIVWLNAGSEISFDKYFNKQAFRSVQLNGEAYFEVKHMNTRPFIVHSGKLTTTVLGTSFSIRAYRNETHTSVAVNSGKVGVIKTGVQQRETVQMLLPNDKLTYNDKNGEFIKTIIPNKEVDSWTRGELNFEQAPLAEVFETISRKYNVKIDADRKLYKTCKLTAKFKNQPLEKVLKMLHITFNINSKQIGQTIYLKGGSCM